MGFWSDLFKSKARTPVLTGTPAPRRQNQIVTFNVGGIATPYELNPYTYIDKAYKQNIDVYAIVSEIAARAAEAPLEQYKVTEEKSFRKGLNHARLAGSHHQFLAKSIFAKALDQVQDSDMLRLLGNPNKYQSGYDFYFAAFVTYLLSGNLYIYKQRGLTGTKIYELHVMPSYDIEPVNKPNSFREVDYYQVRSQPGLKIMKEDMIHIFNFNPLSADHYLPPVGMSPLEPARAVLQKANTIETSSVDQYANMGAVGAAYLEDKDTEPDVVPELESHWRQKFKSAMGSIMWSGTKIGFTRFTSSPKELDILPMSKYSTEQLCRVYRYPSLLLSNDAKTLDNYQVAVKQLIVQCVIPLQQAFCRGLARSLMPDFKLEGDVIKFDYMYYAEMQDDIVEVGPVLQQLTFLTLNEKRDWLGFDRVEDANADIPSALLAPVEQPTDPNITQE